MIMKVVKTNFSTTNSYKISKANLIAINHHLGVIL